MTASSSVDTSVEPDDPPIGHHYLLVILVQVVVLSTLVWMAASFR